MREHACGSGVLGKWHVTSGRYHVLRGGLDVGRHLHRSHYLERQVFLIQGDPPLPRPGTLTMSVDIFTGGR